MGWKMTRTSRDNSCRRSLLAGTAGLTLAMGAACLPVQAQAQAQTTKAAPTSQDAPQALDEIVVTAERFERNVQKTAASVTVQTGQDLLTQGKFTLSTILETVPGVSGGESEGVSNEPTGNDSPAAGITIRGVSSNGGLSGQTLSGVPATALYVDNVYNGIGGGYDVDRVEVLRGPQGTLYGRSATAGVVAIHTRNPNLAGYSVDASVEAGSYDLRRASVAVNAPIVSDHLALRVAANHYERDGADVDKGFGASRGDDVKLKLLALPSDGVSLLIGASMQDRTLYNGGAAGNLVAPNTVEYTPYSVGTAKLKSRQVWAELNVDLGPARLTYLPAYRSFNQDATVFVVGPGGNSIKQIVTTPEDDFVTHELRLTSQPDSMIKWQTGLFYYSNGIRSSNRNVWESSDGLLFSADIDRKTRDLGVFAEATVPVTQALRLTGGLRWDKTTVTTAEVYSSNLSVFCNTPLGFVSGCAVAGQNSPLAGLPESISTIKVSGNAGRRAFKNLTYKARVEYDLAPANLLYASISSAFLPGDVQIGTGAGNVPTVYPYDSEKLTAYEIGSKNRFFDRRLQVNLGAFYYDYAGYQASVQLDQSNPASAVLFNVPLRMVGVELETLFQLSPADRIGLNVSHIDSKFHDLPAGFADAVAQRELWGFAPTSLTLLYDHQIRLSGGSTLNLHGDGAWRSAYDVRFTTPGLAAQGGLDYERQKALFQGNLNLTWASANDRLSVTGYVRNVTDKRYKTYVNLQSISPLQASATLSDPRTFGVVLTGKF
ncbi:Outer membrane receptor proteins, mostly Fe transport [Caulobacter sp. UNC279MFTsu5.1]|nr:Outer membrane receptor proteins, mostly Fe transport [Caulobacter sp. UNC279MFTsu5.1]